jgi:hypothetical protein
MIEKIGNNTRWTMFFLNDHDNLGKKIIFKGGQMMSSILNSLNTKG